VRRFLRNLGRLLTGLNRMSASFSAILRRVGLHLTMRLLLTVEILEKLETAKSSVFYVRR
jgi:hypothetical protein